MDLSQLQRLAAGNTWGALLPELALVCLALLLLIVDLVLPKRTSDRAVPALALAGQLAVLAGLLCRRHSLHLDQESFNGLLRDSWSVQWIRIFLVLSSVLVTVLTRVVLPRQSAPRTEFHHIVLVVTAAMMLLVRSNHFVMLFVSLETLTIGFYILVSYFRSSGASLEAGLKYLILGALSSSLLLFGIALLYGVAGNPLLPGHTANALRYEDLAAFLALNPHNFLAAVGIVLVLAGVAFKIGAFPFQIWIPDVYQGAPTPVTAFLAVASKGAGFALLLGLTLRAFPAYGWLVTPLLTFMAMATILFGNFAALGQHNVKRLIGLSGVSHAGFLLLGVAAAPASALAVPGIVFYLYAYLLATFAVFGVMAHLAGPDDADQELDHYAGLAKDNPFLGAVLLVGLGSLAGIPPLAGFLGKFAVFIAAYQAGLKFALGVAIAGVVLSIYYYFGWIRAAYFESWRPSPEPGAKPAPTPVGWCLRVSLFALALCSVVLGFYPGPLGHWLRW
ncbi:MAG TPA: NADH-quinone oxidoreductase subunit N [Opitutaceae bacterium]|nr:NADH-quinone oxidoreductase subunit N [Opitutaceae bacterium]